MTNKQQDLAGPGISTYEEVAKILPQNYQSLLTPKETMKAVFAVKNYIEENLNKELNLMMVQVPLIVDKASGVNDTLDRDGSRTPVDFPCGLGLEKRFEAQVVQAATKWKRMALKTFDMGVGEGLNTDMRAVRKDYFLDHDHSAYVDQWDWEKTIDASMRNLDFLTDTVQRIWKVFVGAEEFVQDMYPQLKDPRFPNLVRHLRKLYPDPMTGADWELVTDSSKGIIGVRSRSDLEPFRQDGFPKALDKLKGKEAYNEWEFVFETKKKPKASQTRAATSAKN